MHELRTIFPHGLNDRIGDEFKTDNKHINMTAKFSSLPRKHSGANHGCSPSFTTAIFKWFQSYAENYHQRCSYLYHDVDFQYEKIIFKNYPSTIEHKIM